MERIYFVVALVFDEPESFDYLQVPKRAVIGGSVAIGLESIADHPRQAVGRPDRMRRYI